MLGEAAAKYLSLAPYQWVGKLFTCVAMATPGQWAKWVPWAEFNYNTWYHIQQSWHLFEVVYGRPHPKFCHITMIHLWGQQWILSSQDRDLMLAEELKMFLQRAQQYKLDINDWIYIKLCP